MTHISVVLKDRFKHGWGLIGDEQLGQQNLIKSYKAARELQRKLGLFKMGLSRPLFLYFVFSILYN